jgi:putative flippase GtrA
MGYGIKKTVATISQKGGIFTFLRAQFSSQLASLTDFLVSILLANIFNFYYAADEYCLPLIARCFPLYVYASFIGSVCGGIVNCAVNYKWTFKTANEVRKRHMAIKYFAVWCGSIFLNTYGIYLLTELLGKTGWLIGLPGHLQDNVFVVSKIVVSLIVGFAWNYNMQRVFVYRNYNYRKFLLCRLGGSRYFIRRFV